MQTSPRRHARLRQKMVAEPHSMDDNLGWISEAMVVCGLIMTMTSLNRAVDTAANMGGEFCFGISGKMYFGIDL